MQKQSRPKCKTQNWHGRTPDRMHMTKISEPTKDRNEETYKHVVTRQHHTGGSGRRHSGTGADSKTTTRETGGKTRAQDREWKLIENQTGNQ